MPPATDDDAVRVDLLDGAPAAAVSTPGPSPARRGGTAVAIAAVLVAALLLWPDAPATLDAAPAPPGPDGVPAPEDPRLLPWPGRGPLVSDDDLVAAAAAAWADAASADADVPAPGDDVHPLWAGEVGALEVAVLQSVGPDALLRVAHLVGAGPSTTEGATFDVAAVGLVDPTSDLVALSYPDGLGDGVLARLLDTPGAALVQALLAPDVQDEAELRRLEAHVFLPVGMLGDGLSLPWVYEAWHSPEGPVVAAVRTVDGDAVLEATGLVVPGEPGVDAAPVELVPSLRGARAAPGPEDYVDAATALASLGETTGRASVLASTPLGSGRASLVQVQPDTAATSVVTVVARRGIGEASAARPLDASTDLVIGAVRLLSGETVVVASGPPDTSRLVVGADDVPVSTGPHTVAVRLERGVDAQQVSVQGYREDETYVGRATLDVSDL